MLNRFSFFRHPAAAPADGLPPDSAIGLPRALVYFLFPGLWEAFFAALGRRVILSPTTTRDTVEQAARISEAEHCLPVKLLDAHVAALIGKADVVFVPRILSTLPGRIACPKLGALPDAVQAQFAGRVTILTEEINLATRPLADSLRRLGARLQATPATVRAAVAAGLAAFEESARPRPAAAGAPRLLVLGHPYNLHDPYIPAPILSKLERMGVGFDLMDFHRAPAGHGGPIRWDACGLMHDTLEGLQPGAYAGVLQLSSFNCGCDSIAGRFFADTLRRRRIPLMTIVLDEHAAQAGVDTRLEAFVDTLQAAAL